MADPELSFAALLRRLRAGAGLTQEELAETAGLSPRSVSGLERGINRTARKDTALLLADALSLTGQVRALFVAAARGRAPAADVLATGNGAPEQGAGAVAATRTLPRDIGSFTGREAELRDLLAVLAGAAEGGADNHLMTEPQGGDTCCTTCSANTPARSLTATATPNRRPPSAGW